MVKKGILLLLVNKNNTCNLELNQVNWLVSLQMDHTLGSLAFSA